MYTDRLMSVGVRCLHPPRTTRQAISKRANPIKNERQKVGEPRFPASFSSPVENADILKKMPSKRARYRRRKGKRPPANKLISSSTHEGLQNPRSPEKPPDLPRPNITNASSSSEIASTTISVRQKWLPPPKPQGYDEDRLPDEPTWEQVCKPIPEAHKFIHILRSFKAWHNIVQRCEWEVLENIHDPGLTPGGILSAGEFYEVYPFLRIPELIVTSPLRRCLQTALRLRETLISSRKAPESIRIVANPDLQETSTWLCDTGSPLDVLRENFPSVEFPDQLFPDVYPRLAHVKPEKKGTIYDDSPHLLAARGERVRKYLQDLRESEIIVITHGIFAHYLINFWESEPGRSFSGSIPFMRGFAQPYIMSEDASIDAMFTPFMRYMGPWCSEEGDRRDNEPEVYAYMRRDCGVFTDIRIANAIGKA